MKKPIRAVVLTLAMSLVAITAHAATTHSFWDGATDTPPGGATSPNGTWEHSNWSTLTAASTPIDSAVSHTAASAYVESTDAHFCAGTASTGTYTVTIGSNHTVSGFDLDDAGNCTLTGPGVLTLTSTGDGVAVTNGGTLYISNVIAGTAGGFLNVSGNANYGGTLVLGGANTFTGNSTDGGLRCITGTVVASNDLCFGTTANSFINMFGGTLSFPTGTHTVTNKICWAVSASATSFLAGSGTVNFNGPCVLQNVNVTPPYIICNGTGDVFFNGVVSDDTRGALLVSGPGAGRVIFTGANTYTGYLYLERANFAVGNNASVNGQLHFDGVYASTFLQAYGGARTISKVVVFDNYQFVNNTGLGVTMTGNNPFTMSGIVDLYTNNPSESIILANTADTIISGQIVSTVSGAGTGSSVSISASRCGLNIYGPGRIVFQNINNTYTGDTLVTNGATLCLQNVSGNATGTGTVQVTGGTLTGTGTAGKVSVNPGGTIIPGNAPANGTATLNTGNQTWAGGGHYAWQISDATGTSGTSDGWSVIKTTGTLAINATSGSQFNIDITSLVLSTGLQGTLTNFNNTKAYSWPILTASGGITGFNPANINITDGHFANSLGTGGFSVSTSGNTMYLNFTNAPGVTATNYTVQCGGSVGFAATVTQGSPAPTVTYTNTTTGLPITSPSSFPSGTTTVSVYATNGIGAAATTTFTVTVTDTPIPGPFSLGAVDGTSSTFFTAKMLALASSPVGGTLTVASVVSPTPGGATVTLSGGSPQTITYTPTAFIGNTTDTITYTLSDGCGTAVSNISVVVSPNGPGANGPDTASVSGAITYHGIPGTSYTIQSSPNVGNNPTWTPVTVGAAPGDAVANPVIADPSGMINYQIVTPVPASTFYRTSQP